MTHIPARLAIRILPTLGLTLACGWLAPEAPGELPTTPTGTQTLGPIPSTVTATSMSSPTPPPEAEPQLELTIVPYPTPGDPITSWSELLDSSTLENVRWAEFVGSIQGDTKGLQWPISVPYPYGWTVTQAGATILSIQNEPPESFPAYQGPFVKFEVLWLRERPQANAGLPPVTTVLISGERSILWENRWYGTLIVGSLVNEGATYYGAHGYISRVNNEEELFYKNIILHMISSLSMRD